MNYPVLIVSEGLSHLGYQIFKYLDYKSLMQARATCKDWFVLIETSPNLWKCVILTLRRRYLLIHPFWKELQSKIELQNHVLLSKQLMDYQWRDFMYDRSDWCGLFYVGQQHCICIIYGSLKRLKFFWPYIQNFQHPKQVLHYAAYFALNEVLEFLIEHLRDRKQYFKGRVDDKNGHTPLHIAAIKGHFETVKILLPHYTKDPTANGKTSYHCAFSEGQTKIAHYIQNWFDLDNAASNYNSKRIKMTNS